LGNTELTGILKSAVSIFKGLAIDLGRDEEDKGRED